MKKYIVKQCHLMIISLVFIISSSVVYGSPLHIDKFVPVDVAVNTDLWALSAGGGIVAISFGTQNGNNPHSCRDANVVGFYLNDPASNIMISTAMAAVVSGKKLHVYTEGCLDWGNASNVLPRAVQFRIYGN